MKNSARTIIALVAAALITPVLASALSVTVTQVQGQVQNRRHAVVVTFSNSPASSHWAESIATRARGGVALFIRDLPAGIYSAVVLKRE